MACSCASEFPIVRLDILRRSARRFTPYRARRASRSRQIRKASPPMRMIFTRKPAWTLTLLKPSDSAACFRFCEGFRTPAEDAATRRSAGVRKPPRKETAGDKAPGGPRRLWRFGRRRSGEWGKPMRSSRVIGGGAGHVPFRLAAGSPSIRWRSGLRSSSRGRVGTSTIMAGRGPATVMGSFPAP